MTARRPSTAKVEVVSLPDDGPNYLSDDDGPLENPTKHDGDENRVAMMGHHQQRAMAAALRDHGITTDAGVYDFLSAFLGREIGSRKELTTVEAARVIRDLIDNPPTHGPTAEQWAALAAPFPPDQIEKLPKVLDGRSVDKGRCNSSQYSADGYHCGGRHSLAIHLDYVGHGGITMRLNEVVGPAGWSWEPVAFGQDGLPNVGREFWIRLTVLGVSKYGVGDDFGNSGKQAIGDALRNAAMRFGIATYLWSKSDAAKLIAAGGDPDSHVVAPSQGLIGAGTPVTPQESSGGLVTDDLTDMGTADLLLLVDDFAQKASQPFASFTEAWRRRLVTPNTPASLVVDGVVTVDALDDLPPAFVAEFVRALRAGGS